MDTILKSREVIEKLPAFQAHENDEVYDLVMESSRLLRRRATAEILKAAEPSLIGNLDKVDDYVTIHARELEWEAHQPKYSDKSKDLFSTMLRLLETVNHPDNLTREALDVTDMLTTKKKRNTMTFPIGMLTTISFSPAVSSPAKRSKKSSPSLPKTLEAKSPLWSSTAS